MRDYNNENELVGYDFSAITVEYDFATLLEGDSDRPLLDEDATVKALIERAETALRKRFPGVDVEILPNVAISPRPRIDVAGLSSPQMMSPAYRILIDAIEDIILMSIDEDVAVPLTDDVLIDEQLPHLIDNEEWEAVEVVINQLLVSDPEQYYPRIVGATISGCRIERNGEVLLFFDEDGDQWNEDPVRIGSLAAYVLRRRGL